uniref:Translocation protein SEC62 n=1 Tax=Paramormyrops kingsleyae TaxID=1676925 RepID=A0A3B3QA35_9TELE
MAERRRHKKRIQEVGEPTKEEKAVAKYLRFNCSTKSTNMMGHRVEYFIASKAVDCLMDSKWAKSKKGEDAIFTTRESVVDYCNRLLKKQFFHRALKVMKKKPEKDTKKEKEKEKEKDKEKDKEKEKEREKAKTESGKEEDKRGKKEKKKESEVADSKKEKTSPGTPKKKKDTKKKFKLEPHEDQVFLDGNEVYVWIYDPVHFKTFAMGLILALVSSYFLCVFTHLRPLSSARCILFLIIWVVTGGRHHFWFLPNLTADVGFIDSFRPLYTHEYKGPRADGKKAASEAASEKAKAEALEPAAKEKSDSEERSDGEKKDGNGDEEEEEEDDGEETKAAGEGSGGEGQGGDTDSDRREDEGSQHSNGNDFEMITREELEQHTEEEEEDEGEYEEEEEAEESEAKPLSGET